MGIPFFKSCILRPITFSGSTTRVLVKGIQEQLLYPVRSKAADQYGKMMKTLLDKGKMGDNAS